MAPSASLKLLLLAASFLTVDSAVLPKYRRDIDTTTVITETVTVDAWAKPVADEVTDNVLKLTRGENGSRSSALLNALRKANKKSKAKRDGESEQDEGPGQDLQSALQNSEYLTEIAFNGETVSVIVDTGSSDTWLISSDFKCVDASGASQAQSACKFGPLYNNTFAAEDSVPNVNFNISYGDGEFVTGTFGYADITVAGIEVPRQQAALGNYAYWSGDGISSGLLGLAYSAITSEYAGSNPSQDGKNIPYDPIFTTMWKNNLSSPSFSMAIERGTGGYLAFGGVPPVNTTSEYASVPIEMVTTRSGEDEYAFYTLTPDAFVYGSGNNKNTDQYIVDSGTTLWYASSTVVSAINGLFTPAAQSQSGLYYVDCNAQAPTVGVTLGGQNFMINPVDMILSAGNGQCISGVQDGGSGPYILGDVFMQNVVVVFDVGAAQMRFASHMEY